MQMIQHNFCSTLDVSVLLDQKIRLHGTDGVLRGQRLPRRL